MNLDEAVEIVAERTPRPGEGRQPGGTGMTNTPFPQRPITEFRGTIAAAWKMKATCDLIFDDLLFQRWAPLRQHLEHLEAHCERIQQAMDVDGLPGRAGVPT